MSLASAESGQIRAIRQKIKLRTGLAQLHRRANQVQIKMCENPNLNLAFSLTELRNYRKNWEAFDLIVNGSYPRLHEEKLKSGRFFNGYLQTYVERDVRALIKLKDSSYIIEGFVLYNGNEQLTLKGTRVINPIKYAGLDKPLSCINNMTKII